MVMPKPKRQFTQAVEVVTAVTSYNIKNFFVPLYNNASDLSYIFFVILLVFDPLLIQVSLQVGQFVDLECCIALGHD